MDAKKNKWPPNHKTDHNSIKFQTRSSSFCMVVYPDLWHFFFKKKITTRNKMVAKTQNGIENSKK